jgi:hypothetical protein
MGVDFCGATDVMAEQFLDIAYIRSKSNKFVAYAWLSQNNGTVFLRTAGMGWCFFKCMKSIQIIKRMRLKKRI